jgi:hypothetical protein
MCKQVVPHSTRLVSFYRDLLWLTENLLLFRGSRLQRKERLDMPVKHRKKQPDDGLQLPPGYRD